MYPIATIANALQAQRLSFRYEGTVEHLVYDTRRVQQPATSLFFALKTEHGDGHDFLQHAWERGLRQFVVSRPPQVENS